MTLPDLLNEMERKGASDLFLTIGQPPRLRVLGQLEEADGAPVDEETLTDFLSNTLPPHAFDQFREQRDLDIGISLSETQRFRLNLFFQRGAMGLAARRVPLGNLDFDSLGVPPALRRFAEAPRGLVLITGATGTGKSTTLAALLHFINAHYARHIVTVEDPIEFLHRDLRSMVSQREVGSDTRTFADALRHVVRQNPDAIFIGEMRDLETMRTAISAALTGHLVVSTLHTADVMSTIERILNYFPDTVRRQVAADLSHALTGIASQRLARRKDGTGRVPAFEILTATPWARRLIRAQDLDGLHDVLKSGDSDAMCTFTQSLVGLYREGLITADEGAAQATDRDEFLLRVEGMETGVDTLRAPSEDGEAPSLGIRRLLYSALEANASDLILTTGAPPLIRQGGDIRELEAADLTPSETRHLLFSVLSPAQRAQFETDKEIDFALTITDDDKTYTNRFRVNGFYQKGCVAAAFRLIPSFIPDPDDLRIPPVVMNLAKRHQGLVLVTGPTGHGKSTTLACLIDAINRDRRCHIITIEDPIEFVHGNRLAAIEQREVHADTHSFANALKYVLRQDPDVILVGEMRDPETIAAALTAAETGHLVLATLHTNNAPQTVDRIIDIFPGNRQNQIRTQLAATLEAVVAQRLLPVSAREGDRVPAFEVMLGTPGIRAQIRDNRTHQLPSSIETGAKDGMITLDKALLNLYNENLISRRTVKSLARDPTIV